MFRRKKSGYRVKGTAGYKEPDFSLFIFLALFTGIFLIKAGTLMSAPAVLVLVAGSFNGCVFSSRYCRARGTLAGEIREGSLQQIYKLPLIRSFLILLFKNDYADGPCACST